MAVAVPEVVDFCRALAPAQPYHRALRELHGALVGLDPSLDLTGRLAALERLARWVRDPGPLPLATAPPVEGAPPEPWPTRKLRVVVELLEQVDPWRAGFAGVCTSLLAETSGVHLLAEIGVPNDRGFLEETADRLAERLLPSAREERDLGELASAMFPGKKDPAWLRGLPPELLARVVALAGPTAFAPLAAALADALRLLATRVSALGLSEEVRARSSPTSLPRSPFYQLPRAIDGLLAGTGVDAGDVGSLAELCRAELMVVHDNLERAGVSVDVVYRMDVIGHCLARIETLTPLAARTSGVPQALALLASLLDARRGEYSLRALVRNNLRLLARKIIERVGETGEHYITATRRAWWAMLRSAAGGGVLTAGTAAIKFMTVWGHFPLFVDGFLSALNYSLSFLLMQFLGFTLATKQPSMTAAALAHSLKGGTDSHRLDELVGLIARMTRSQLAAAIGNVGLTVPAAWALDQYTRWQTGHAFLDAKTAAYVVGSMHPTRSGTLWYATLTGVLLWMSSLGAGWLENWATYRKMPEAIAHHRAKRVVGARVTRWLASKFQHHVAGAGGSITLGFLLGLTPVFGKGFGLPLDVRHVTLSAASLTLAGCSLGADMIGTSPYLAAMLGVACIGILNFGVSFVLALMIALRAREIGTKERVELAKALLVRLVQRPMEFLYPPKENGATGTMPPPHH